MANLLDLMSEEDREISRRAFERRMAGDKSFHKITTVSPEMYLIAELGYYYGWEAVKDITLGYWEVFDEETQQRRKRLFTLEEASVLVEAARKVWYSRVIDMGRANLVATGSSLSKNPTHSFEKGMKEYMKGAKL